MEQMANDALAMFAFAVLSILGFWKLGEIIYWAVTHVRVSW